MQKRENSAWHHHIMRATTECRLQCYERAIVLFATALDEALAGFTTESRVRYERALSRVLIAQLSLAECQAAVHNHDEAVNLHLGAMDFLLDQAARHADNSAVMAELISALGHANTRWALFLKQHRQIIAPAVLHTYQQRVLELLQYDVDFAVYH